MCLCRFYFPLILRLTNDVETNTGPIRFGDSVCNRQFSSTNASYSLLTSRLFWLGLRSVDVGGTGDYFGLFRINYLEPQNIISNYEPKQLNI